MISGLHPQAHEWEKHGTCMEELFLREADCWKLLQIEIVAAALKRLRTIILHLQAHEWKMHGTCAEELFPREAVFFNATLTLPGIAGLILGLGMAVDSNVLIFERIREELRTGKTVLSAVDQGFDRAFVTIIDTHVTTIVSSLFLFIFGTGPIRGFAVTLVLGLLANLFSAVYVSRTIFIWLLNRKGRRVESLSI